MKWPFILVTGVVSLLSLLVHADDPSPINTENAKNPQRIIPPVAIDCGEYHMTVYSGIVSDYVRNEDQTRLVIKTDWGTSETVILTHPGNTTSIGRFLVRGKPFMPEDWSKIISESGHLLPNTRARAWVCEGGNIPPLIDWQPSEIP